MQPVVVWGLAYIVGLLLTAIPMGGAIVFGCGVISAIVALKKSRKYARIFAIAGCVGLLAGIYLQFRTPQPNQIDVSRFVPQEKQEVTVSGKVAALPKLTQSGKLQVWFDVAAVGEQKADGKLYVTLPEIEGKDLFPRQAIAITGNLYKPKPKMNPGGFDFQKYLAQEGSFAGLSGKSIRLLDLNQKPEWGWWMVQKQIVRSQTEQLGQAEGAIVAAMVIGGQVVDIPFDVKEAFSKIGLSHALAASGFQVTLILGVLLALTRRLPKVIQISCCGAGLICFAGLTGLQPSVMRAVLMGFAILIGLAFERKVKPLQSLLIVSIILLIWNPLWIWSLSFQFSFLATLGLLITVPALSKRLDWLPTVIVPAIAVPISALLWTLPLQLFSFGIVSPYCILANLLTTVLISFISLGGIVSAGVNFVFPAITKFASPILYYPTHWLIELVKFFCQLPGNSIAVGTISTGLLITLYALICTPWLFPKFRRQWWAFLLVGMNLVFIPAWYTRSNLLQITALSAGAKPVIVVQDHGRVGLINSGQAEAVKFTVLPFLRKEGINHIDWAIAASPAMSDGWKAILEAMPIRALYDFSGKKQQVISLNVVEQLAQRSGKYVSITPGQKIESGTIKMQFLSVEPTIVQIAIAQQRWLWLRDAPNVSQSQALGSALVGNEILWWSGRQLHPKLIEKLQPETAIAYSKTIHPETLTQLQQNRVQIYQTEADGALQWTKNQGFQTSLEVDESDGSFL